MKRILILDDDNYEYAVFDDGDAVGFITALKFVAKNPEIYQVKTVFWEELVDKFIKLHSDFSEFECKGIVSNMIENIIYSSSENKNKYFDDSFNELWEMTE